jgi:hypothetical protein
VPHSYAVSWQTGCILDCSHISPPNMPPQTTQRLRSACDNCHRMKIRCLGDNPCENCIKWGSSCAYSYTFKLGRPQGAKNKKQLQTEAHSRSTSSLSTENVVEDSNSHKEEPTAPTRRPQQLGERTASTTRVIDPSIMSINDGFNNTDIFNSILETSGMNKDNEWVRSFHPLVLPYQSD